jgi:thiamine biosynthesis lipoprotein
MSSQIPSRQEVVSWSAPSMGGRLEVSVLAPPSARRMALGATRRTAQRVEAWASRLTRFCETSDLCRLNAVEAASSAVRPTLGAVLGWAATASERSGRVVDVTMLDARLAAESGEIGTPADLGTWSVELDGRAALVTRPPGVRFDLGGVAKGWIADRAADLLGAWSGAAVDADGDISMRAGPGVEWHVAVVDPRADDRPPLVTLRVVGGDGWTQSTGVATSGTSVHRWADIAGRPAHHLIDPRTGRPAETDVVQATVVAATAREAEMLAKTAIILGSTASLPFLFSSSARAAILLLASGDLLALPGIEKWLV